MKIYVCIKQVPDTAAHIKIVNKNFIDDAVTFIINPYDEHALTEALKLKASSEDTEVVAVTIGNEQAMHALRFALAMGADYGIFIKTDKQHDSIFKAAVLKAAIKQDGKPDIIFTGKEAIDTGSMQTLFRLAEALGFPVASNVTHLSTKNGNILVECSTDTGDKYVYRLNMPCIIGAGKGLNVPKYPSFSDIAKARNKEIKQIDLARLNYEKPEARMEIIELKQSVEKRNPVEIKGAVDNIVKQLISVIRNEIKGV